MHLYWLNNQPDYPSGCLQLTEQDHTGYAAGEVPDTYEGGYYCLDWFDLLADFEDDG